MAQTRSRSVVILFLNLDKKFIIILNMFKGIAIIYAVSTEKTLKRGVRTL